MSAELLYRSAGHEGDRRRELGHVADCRYVKKCSVDRRERVWAGLRSHEEFVLVFTVAVGISED